MAAPGTTTRTTVADLMIDDRRALRAGLQGERGRTPGAEPARPRADVRPRRRRYLARRRCRSTSCSGRGPCSATPTIVGRCPASIIAAPARIPAAASPARPDTMPRMRSSPTGAGGCRGGDSRSARPWRDQTAMAASRPTRGRTPCRADAADAKTIEDRLRAIEDRLEIYNLIASHPPSADTGAQSYIQSIFIEDAMLDLGGDQARERQPGRSPRS